MKLDADKLNAEIARTIAAEDDLPTGALNHRPQPPREPGKVIVYQLVVRGPDKIGGRQKIHSKRVFRTRAAADAEMDAFCKRCCGDGLWDLESVEDRKVIELHLDDEDQCCATCGETYVNIGHPLRPSVTIQRACACVFEHQQTGNTTVFTARAPTEEERAAFRLKWST